MKKNRTGIFRKLAFLAFILFITVPVFKIQLDVNNIRTESDALREQIRRTGLEIEGHRETLRKLEDLEANPDYIEELARTRLGYYRPGEIIYHYDVVN